MPRLLRPFPEIVTARFLRRPNRFVVDCRADGKTVRAYLPNPGRLWELLFPGVELLLAPTRAGAKLPFAVVAVVKDGLPVMLHTHETNSVARHLLDRRLVPGLEEYRVLRSEVPIGRSRFDFLLGRGSEQFVLEVKSCTLFHGEVAMFPDAVTERGRRHLAELAELRREGIGAGVLFVVHGSRARCFLPEYHTDLAFSRALLDARHSLLVNAVGLTWRGDLSLVPGVRPLKIPWTLAEKEAADRGAYVLVLHIRKSTGITVGALGDRTFRPGYYLYVGSAMQNLSQRIERHKRLRKKHFWHIDYLRENADVVAAVPIRASGRLECELAAGVGSLAEWSVEGFGSSDCACPSHLFGMKANPMADRRFVDLMLHFRMGRLKDSIVIPEDS